MSSSTKVPCACCNTQKAQWASLGCGLRSDAFKSQSETLLERIEHDYMILRVWQEVKLLLEVLFNGDRDEQGSGGA